MAGGAEGQSPVEARRGLMLPGPFGRGVALGVCIPALALLAWWASGDLVESVRDQQAYARLPAFATLVAPALAAGLFVGRSVRDGGQLLRLSVGAFVGASLVGALVMAYSYAALDAWRTLVIALSGGTALTGFWVWVGVLVGGIVAFNRRKA